jgi:hypothetical protein
MTRNILASIVFDARNLRVFSLRLIANAQTEAINSDIISGYGLRNLENAVIIHASSSNAKRGGDTFTSPLRDLFTILKKIRSAGVSAEKMPRVASA